MLDTLFNSSPFTLKLLAAIVWYIGAIVLYIKSYYLLTTANNIEPGQLWIWATIFVGVLIGAIKARYLFSKVGIKNLRRIDALEHPKIWNFYRARFFIMLASMIALAGYLSRMAAGDYTLLLAVTALDLSIATALLGSSYIFWKQPK